MDETTQATPATDAAPRGPLSGRVVIVTGASSGIGAATARELARQGATIVLAARRQDLLEAQVQAITTAGGQALAIPTDVTDGAEITRLVEQTVQAFGRVDVLVNNAGIGQLGWYAKASDESIRQLVDVNLLGAMLLIRAVLPGMLE